MLSQASVRRLLLGASIVCAVPMILSAGAMQAQSLPDEAITDGMPPIAEDSLVLLPLQSVSVSETYGAVPLDTIADDMNAQMADARSQPQEPTGFSLDQLPIVSDLVDEEGNFDWGMDLPVSINVSDVLGAYGVTVDMDFRL